MIYIKIRPEDPGVVVKEPDQVESDNPPIILTGVIRTNIMVVCG